MADSTIAVSPLYKSFGIQILDSTTTQAFRISNTGDADLGIGTVGSMVQPFWNVGGTWISDQTIAPAGYFDATVAYIPSALGVATDYIEIPSNDPQNPTFRVDMDGTCQQAIISSSPIYKSFGIKELDSTTTQVFRISNTGNVNLVGTAGTMVLPFYAVGTWLSDTTIAPAGYFDATVAYIPNALDSGATDYIEVTSNDPVNPTFKVYMDGTCQQAIISSSPTYKSFGIKGIDSTTTQVFRISNTGNVNLVGTAGTMVLPFYAVGAWLSDTTIAPSGYFDATVAYIPNTVDSGATDYIEVISNDPVNPTFKTYMDGTCQQAIIAVSPTYKSFGIKNQGTTTDQTVTVSNSGNIALVMGTLSGLAVPYSMVGNAVSGRTINAGDSSTVVVRYAPVAFGVTSDTMVMPSNDPVTPSYSFMVDGTSSAEDISVSPASYNFGVVPCNFIADVLVTVTNAGNQDLTMTTVTGFGAQSPFSVIEDHVSGQTLTANDSRTLTVRFLTKKKNVSTGVLIINSSDPDTPAYGFIVTGNSNSTLNHGEGRRAASADGHQLSDYAA